MPRLWSLLVIALMAALVAASGVHARELPGPAVGMLECSGQLHVEDSDQGKGEPGKAAHSHGGCHAAAAALPTMTSDDGAAMHVRVPQTLGRQPPLATRTIDPALRPPAA